MQPDTNHTHQSRFLHRCISLRDSILVEAVLPGGSIKQVFRNTDTQRLIIQGRVDRLTWSIEDMGDLPASLTHGPPGDEFLELQVPPQADLSDVIIMEKFSKGRVVFKIPRNDVMHNYS